LTKDFLEGRTLKDLEGKVVVVSGAGRGLGAAFALSLADVGCELVLCGRRVSDLEVTAKLVGERSGKTPEVVELDLSAVQSVTQALSRILVLKPKVDILINNGAMWLEHSSEPIEAAEVLGVVNSAVTGTFLLTQGLRPVMEVSLTPDVVTIGSVSGLPNAALQTVSVPFYAAKRAQVALAEGLRQEFAGTKFRSILVNPPYLDDVRPDQTKWLEAAERQKGQRGTSRDVIEATIFALTRPRHVTLTVEIDSDNGGLFS
jgi:NAD(P)-dependent dehydrogenase (short-subunit alcohol dehydrogenase family)